MTDARPTRSYCIWFSQRVGSTLLTHALEDTGIAGRPREWFNFASTADMLGAYGVANAVALRGDVDRGVGGHHGSR